jgi:hypothetical protein
MYIITCGLLFLIRLGTILHSDLFQGQAKNCKGCIFPLFSAFLISRDNCYSIFKKSLGDRKPNFEHSHAMLATACGRPSFTIQNESFSILENSLGELMPNVAQAHAVLATSCGIASWTIRDDCFSILEKRLGKYYRCPPSYRQLVACLLMPIVVDADVYPAACSGLLVIGFWMPV